MKSIGVADLKTNLSRYLKRVRKGERLLVMDRSEPIAEVVPYRGKELDDPWKRLARDGKVRLGSQDWGSLRVSPATRKIDLQKVLDELREERG